ncbi:glycoside hydrolase [Trichodelitschia bisporula]|uniref:Mannan endo-1,6-alpha-mannosidase n=1 Tax=Trichodelitschia bisporula TaxID=703511 RepID=A0A6G1I0F9_9PEZI|nr:glycoside hydrolase [Trichodelitschia bisporula]
MHLRASLLIFSAAGAARALSFADDTSVKSSAQSIATGLLAFYPPSSNTPGAPIGLFPPPNDWWQAGAAWSALAEYARLTGDAGLNSVISTALAAQAGPNADFRPANQSSNETNFAQSLWALSALAADRALPPNPSLSYLSAAKTVAAQQAARWDMSSCGGGLNTSIAHPGATKDTLSLGYFFLLHAALALHTRDAAYAAWASRAYDWGLSAGLVTPAGNVFDFADAGNNCSSASTSRVQWSAGAGAFLWGAAAMYNLTFSQTWVTRTAAHLATVNATFFQAQSTTTLSDPACGGSCSMPQRAYKGLLAKALVRVADLAPFAHDQAQNLLVAATRSVVRGCGEGVEAGGKAVTCAVGGRTGVGEQVFALELTLGLVQGRLTLPGAAASRTAAGTAVPTATTKKGGGVRRGVGVGVLAVCLVGGVVVVGL